MVNLRTKPDRQPYTFPGFGSEKFPNLMLRGAGDLDNWRLAVYEQKHEGYQALKKALQMAPVEVTAEVKASGLRGRGGAGFLTGLKWSFMPKDTDEKKFTRYVVCNADEGEPGTFKDRAIMEYNPHQLIEGMIIAGWAMQCQKGFIYVRGEFKWMIDKLDAAIQEAREKGYLGKNILGSGFDFDLDTYRGAGAYVCGEESALLNSLEGRRGEPRSKPPFPAQVGAYGKPTTVNNVETLAAVPPILRMGAAEYSKIGSPNNTGTRIFGISGHVKRPGVYELPMGTTLDFIINEIAGGTLSGRPIKAIQPGGASCPFLTVKDLDCGMDFDQLKARGTMAGSGGVMVMDDSTDMVQVTLRLAKFYAHESCGQCTPCREGTNWMQLILERIVAGEGRMEDLDLLTGITPRIGLKTLCALGDAAAGPVESAVKVFRSEFEHYITHKRSLADGPALVSHFAKH